jgi:protein ImuB
MALPYSLSRPTERPRLTPVAPATSTTAEPSAQLWLALLFPSLSLEALGISPQERTPITVLDGEESRAKVCAVTQGGHDGGIRWGMNPPMALSLVPNVKFVHRNSAAESEALYTLAAFGEHFTPTISVHAPDTILLEMRGSLHLFGDEQTLRIRLLHELAAQGHRVVTSFAPTPRGALWCVRARHETFINDTSQLKSALGGLPLTALRWPAPWQDAFDRLGTRTLRDVMRLPREGLTRRFGPELVLEIDRALGLVPDPVILWGDSPEYEDTEDLGFDTWQTQSLSPAIEKLLTRMKQSLRVHDAGVRSFEIQLRGYRKTVESVTIGTRDVMRDLHHWMKLVATHLEKVRLTQPVHEIHLVSSRFERFDTHSEDLFERRTQAPTLGLAQLIDTLRARLGRPGVAGLKMVATRRPEKAWRYSAPGKPVKPCIESAPRPLWLLKEPLPLPTRGLTIDTGPERIECGGWLGWEVKRDYYVAHDPRGVRLWIYRELNQPVRWFLHGFFA